MKTSFTEKRAINQNNFNLFHSVYLHLCKHLEQVVYIVDWNPSYLLASASINERVCHQHVRLQNEIGHILVFRLS